MNVASNIPLVIARPQAEAIQGGLPALWMAASASPPRHDEDLRIGE